MFSIISIITVLRYKTFTSPNFDLGISSQNFYYLKKIGIPYSTCERNKLISHFTVHISPIYYLILPIYFLFSTPLTLQIISSLIISSAIIPIYLLTKNYNFKPSMSLLICLIYSLYTPAICSIIYDFHENIFLTPLLLWIFYFYEKNKKIPFIITSILILMIKEDSAIYLIIFGIYTLFDNKKQYGISLIIFSFLYFIIAIHLLNNYGEGIMMDRYDNLTYNNSGILGIIKTFLINPGYFLKQLILSKDNDINKIKYLVQLLLPLGFIPLYSKKGKNYILLIPILLTIMTTYIYSYDINFHYSCGIIAFLFYLFIINIKDLKIKGYLSLCFIGGILTFKVYTFPHLYDNINNYLTNKYEFEQIEKVLKEIPQNASVNASTFLLPHLANRDIVYEIYYHNNEPDINYVVYDMRYDDNIESIDEYLKKGYSKIDNKETNKILILKK